MCVANFQFILMTILSFAADSLPLREVAEHLDKETLKRLKSEYGGLQTLLKNNHQVFEGKEQRDYFFSLTSSCLPDLFLA